MPSNTSNSKKEWFSKAMFLQTLSSMAPIPVIYFSLLFLALPMNIFLWEIDVETTVGLYMDISNYATYGIIYGLSTACLLGCLSALLVFRFQFFGRSSNMIHSLPIRREALFLTQYVVGLCFVLIPNVLILILTLLSCALHGIFYPEPFLILFAVQSALYFFFYSFAVLCASFTGSIGTVAIFYLIFNFIVAFVTLLLEPIFELFYLGYADSTFDYPLVQLLTPIYTLAYAGKVTMTPYNWLSGSENIHEPGGYYNLLPENMIFEMREPMIVCGYLVAAVFMVLAALLINKNRHIESAGEAVSMPVLKPAFRFFISVLGGIAMGIVTMVLLFPDESNRFMELALPASSLFWGLIFGLVAEMILQKSFRVLKYWKRTAVPVLTIGVFFLVVLLDLNNFEDRIASYEETDTILLTGFGAYPNDSAGEQYLLFGGRMGDLDQMQHSLAIEIHAHALDLARNPPTGGDINQQGMYIRYDQGPETVLHRSYVIDYDRTEEEAGTLAYALNLAYNDPVRLAQTYSFDSMIAGQELNMGISGYYNEEIDEFEGLLMAELLTDLTVGELNRFAIEVAEAMKQEFEEGNLGKKYINPDHPDFLNDYYLEINMNWMQRQTSESYSLGKMSYDPEASAETKAEPLGDDENNVVQDLYVNVAIGRDAVHTLAILEEYGAIQEDELMTNLEVLETIQRWDKEGKLNITPEGGYSDPLFYVDLL